MKRLAGVALLMTLAAPVLGQGMDFQQLFSGKEFPHNLKLKDLSSDWRRVNIGTTDGVKSGSSDTMSQLIQAGMMSDKGKGKDDPAAAMLGMSLLSGLFGGGSESKEPIYYTKGQTVTVGSETFLLAYRYLKPATNLMQMAMEAEKGGKEPDFSKMASAGKLSPESPLSVALINVKTISTLNDIRPFDMEQEIVDSGKGGGGLMELIAEQAAKEAKEPKTQPKPSLKPGAPRKPAPKTK